MLILAKEIISSFIVVYFFVKYCNYILIERINMLNNFDFV